MALALMLPLLAACGTLNDSGKATLPAVPSDIQTCFRSAPVNVPDKALSVAEVEALWKSDRVRLVVANKCGKRFSEWYGTLRAGWR
jgi:hypothetical protein